MAFKITDEDGLAEELQRLSQVRFDAVVIKSMSQIYERGKSSDCKTRKTGTPVDSGELIISLSQSFDEVGYTKDYAPHVEYGHRTVNGGYVEGQRFLYANVETQRPIFIEDLKKQIARF